MLHINYHQVHSYTQRPVISKICRNTLRIIVNDQNDRTKAHTYCAKKFTIKIKLMEGMLIKQSSNVRMVTCKGYSCSHV
jgi:hypothetical protein